MHAAQQVFAHALGTQVVSLKNLFVDLLIAACEGFAFTALNGISLLLFARKNVNARLHLILARILKLRFLVGHVVAIKHIKMLGVLIAAAVTAIVSVVTQVMDDRDSETETSDESLQDTDNTIQK